MPSLSKRFSIWLLSKFSFFLPVVVEYIIAEEHEPGSFGVWYGPFSSKRHVLRREGKSSKSCIIGFYLDGTDEVLYRWNSAEYKWERNYNY